MYVVREDTPGGRYVVVDPIRGIYPALFTNKTVAEDLARALNAAIGQSGEPCQCSEKQ